MLLSEANPAAGLFVLVPWIVFAPVIGLLINAFAGKRLGERGVGWVASLASGAAFLVSALQFYALTLHPEGAQVKIAEWIRIGQLSLDWTFRVDSLSVTMMLVVSGVGTLIHIYAIGYMHEDVRFKHDPARFPRFFVFLNLFIAAMMILVSADNYLMLFVGWEGVGLCSFLLIGFWYDLDTLGRSSWANSNAAKKAFITNRVGDFGFLIAGFLIFWYMGSFAFSEVFAAAPEVAKTHPWVITAITVFMLVGVAGKSAQIPLYVWLPDAMAGPTPVSALIHAATMVTAGVYLVTRSFPLFGLTHDGQYIVATVGAVTALFAATIAVGQYDIKKVLAYSTISQLGFMVAAVGMGAYVAGMFHLVTHAFFKALLFLSAGSVILGLERGHHHGHHAPSSPVLPPQGAGNSLSHGEIDRVKEEVFDPGDMRNMGGLRARMPVTFWVYLIGALALAGIFPLAGFWSKDEILLDAFLHYPHVYWLLTLAAFLTAFYMGRQVWMVFFGKARHEAAEHAQESPSVITIPLIILAALSAFGGFINLPFKGFHQFGYWLEHTLGAIEFPPFNFMVAGVSTVLALGAIALSWFLYQRKPLEHGQTDPLAKPLGLVFVGMEQKWFIDEAYQFLFVQPYRALASWLAQKVDWDFWHEWFHDSVLVKGFVTLARLLADPVDLGFIDRVSYWLSDAIRASAETLRKLQNGFVRSYALSVVLGVAAILGYLLLK
ncbi:MAG: NADH-quinone oxidoreductase subunit L [Anaerolineales bacterium]|nr:NADH-quinone oxidoreductase subunit L [Anaerolineales bacterium]MDW8276739.1 NADH-quinone oxidoreductase subunit L [Anaerolineales bacterium]